MDHADGADGGTPDDDDSDAYDDDDDGGEDVTVLDHRRVPFLLTPAPPRWRLLRDERPGGVTTLRASTHTAR